jgi:O-acetyl-ADP-ribose deacetylase (regulator of RNase III)
VSRNTVFPTRSGTAAPAEVVAPAYAMAADVAMVDRATTADTPAWSTGVAAGAASATDAAVTVAADVAANATAATDTVPADIISHRNRATEACRGDAPGGSLMVLLSAR